MGGPSVEHAFRPVPPRSPESSQPLDRQGEGGAADAEHRTNTTRSCHRTLRRTGCK
ncbi:hypothetical protein BaRGS_00000481, partial [Batillaria attramentaria]